MYPAGVTDLRQLLKLKRAQQGTIQKGYQEAGYSGGSGEGQALGSGKGQAGSDGNGAVMEA